ncbi:hypothetical protein BUE80_DR005321 [Diplocarpon rosae]|nr:hypothetical protein BUE80_DR005321 [Diplocarpon rosae]
MLSPTSGNGWLSMLTTLSLRTLLLSCAYLILLAVYRLTLHPLAKYPDHRLVFGLPCLEGRPASRVLARP